MGTYSQLGLEMLNCTPRGSLPVLIREHPAPWQCSPKGGHDEHTNPRRTQRASHPHAGSAHSEPEHRTRLLPAPMHSAFQKHMDTRTAVYIDFRAEVELKAAVPMGSGCGPSTGGLQSRWGLGTCGGAGLGRGGLLGVSAAPLPLWVLRGMRVCSRCSWGDQLD